MTAPRERHPSTNLYGTMSWEEAAAWWRKRALDLAADVMEVRDELYKLEMRMRRTAARRERWRSVMRRMH